jgi:copper chaperone NosL
MNATTRQSIAILSLALAAGSCSTGPRALVVGGDSCDFCRMTIDDLRFGALVLTSKGKLQTFDSIECVASYVAALPEAQQPRGVWVADFDQPTKWLNAREARFLHDVGVRSPMGRDLAAFPPDSSASSLTARFGGSPFGWTELLALVRMPLGTPPLAPRPRGSAPAHAY